MAKRVMILVLMFMFVFQGVSFAGSADIILEDVTYGAMIGGILGGAIWLLDRDNFEDKLATGVGLGVLVGFFLGVTDMRSMVQNEGDSYSFNVPDVMVTEKNGDAFYSVSLYQSRF
ncbi:hypothetical protein ACFLZI_01825 [Nitrospirota bacterium]